MHATIATMYIYRKAIIVKANSTNLCVCVSCNTASHKHYLCINCVIASCVLKLFMTMTALSRSHSMKVYSYVFALIMCT